MKMKTNMLRELQALLCERGGHFTAKSFRDGSGCWAFTVSYIPAEGAADITPTGAPISFTRETLEDAARACIDGIAYFTTRVAAPAVPVVDCVWMTPSCADCGSERMKFMAFVASCSAQQAKRAGADAEFMCESCSHVVRVSPERRS